MTSAQFSLINLTAFVALGLAVPAVSAHSLSVNDSALPSETRAQKDGQVEVRIVTDEADAVLAILAKKDADQPIGDADWQGLFATEGYIRLKQRETAMKRPFADADFKTFVLSAPLLQRRSQLAETLAQWKRADMTGVAQRSLVYLPKEARIHAKIYPVIKPLTNSFVFDVPKDPAIFLYIDPARSKEQFENTLAHELHHIGYGSSCPTKRIEREIARLPQNARDVLTWIGAFGEGFAMLAAAGGPDTHPHEFSPPEDRQRWDHDMANFNDDLKKVETFFLNILDGKLSKEKRDETGYSFFGIQGPWYTVGWKMAVVIEKTYGRAWLIECICDQRQLLPTYNRAVMQYNRAAGESLVGWSPELLARIAGKRIDKKS